MQKNRMLLNTAILTLTSLFLRTTGILYRSFMSEKVTSEGIGLHTLTLSVFTFAMTFSTAGINTAVTRLLSERMGKSAPNERTSILRTALGYGLCVSLTVAAILFFSADYLAETVLKDARTALLLKLLTPSLPLMAVSACFKGYFFAMRKASKPAVSDIFEQFVEMGVFASLIGVFSPYGIAYACAVICAGTTLSELSSCVYLAVSYFRHNTRENKNGHTITTPPRTLKPMLSIAVPVALSSGLGAGLRTVENILIPDGLRKSGLAHDRALSLYGMVRGMALPVMFFPYAFLSAFSTLLIPELSEAMAMNNQVRIRYITARVMQLTLLLSTLVTGIFLIFSEELGLIVYESTEIGRIIWILAPLTVLMYADAIVDGMLKGLDMQVHVLWYNIIDSVIRIALIAWLVPKMGFTGFMIVMYISNIFNPVVSIAKLIRVTKVRISITQYVIKPIVAVFAASFMVRCLASVGGSGFYLTVTGLTIGILAVCFVYIVLLMLTGSLTEEDILWMVSMIQPERKRSSKRKHSHASCPHLQFPRNSGTIE